MTVLCATDLDRTLIYSTAAVEQWGASADLVTVERRLDADASFMTAAAASAFADLAARVPVVPVTTRTSAQLARVRLPGPPPPFAIAANGGVLLVDGEPDDHWRSRIQRVTGQVAPLAEFESRAADLARFGWIGDVRTAEDLFFYAVLDGSIPDDVLAAERERATRQGWVVSLQGRKLYWVPAPLTKSAAVAEVARRLDAHRVLAAGDSVLDAELLSAADTGILARHGELATTSWHRPHVVVTKHVGVEAGAEIVDWFVRSTQS